MAIEPKVKDWGYAVTTVYERLNTLLPITLQSLADGGFDNPWLYIDGLECPYTLDKYKAGDRPLSSYNYTIRYPRVKAFGNWILGLWELYIRQPNCRRYAMFQDDVLCCRNLRCYLDSCDMPYQGYLNLYTNQQNAEHIESKKGWHPSNQKGLGALGLVFTREHVVRLLSSKRLAQKPTTPGHRAYDNFDGDIAQAMRDIGWLVKEYVHKPSLLQHIGVESCIQANKASTQADTFPGADFDASELLSYGN